MKYLYKGSIGWDLMHLKIILLIITKFGAKRKYVEINVNGWDWIAGKYRSSTATQFSTVKILISNEYK